MMPNMVFIYLVLFFIIASMSPPPPAKTRKGFNLIETAIVLGIVGLVIGGIWVAAASVSEARKLNRMVEEISVATDNIRRFFVNGLRPASTITLTAITYQNLWTTIFPPDMVVSGASYLLTPWSGSGGGGDYVLIQINSLSIYYQIGFPSVSQCVNLGPKLYAAFGSQLTAGSKIATLDGTRDISTPSLAAVNCKTAYTNTLAMEIAFTLKF